MAPADLPVESIDLRALLRLTEAIKFPIVRGGEVLPPIGTVADIYDASRVAATGLYGGDDVAERAARDTLPVPSAANREGYHEGFDFDYWLSGLGDLQKVSAAARALEVPLRRVYDFGGSTGRVFRHFSCQLEATEVWSSDFKEVHHRWNQRYMPQEIRAFLNLVYPPLPIPDAHFDVVMAFSVFTHIHELEVPWLLELRRVLRPGGLAYVTIHDETYWSDPDPPVAARILAAGGLAMGGELPEERVAVYQDPASYYHCDVFHHSDYIRKQWGRFFRVVDIIPKHSFRQAVVLLTYA